MSAERNSSAVRNLRSLFENKQQDEPSSNTRGRSPIGRLGSNRESNSSPLSRVRASFVSVDRSGHMAVPAEQGRESSMSAKRESGGTTEDGSVVGKDVTNETPSKPSIFGNGTKADESAVDTPAATPAIERSEADVMPGSAKPNGLPQDSANENRSPATIDDSNHAPEATDSGAQPEQRLSHVFVSGQADSPSKQEPAATPKAGTAETSAPTPADTAAGAAQGTPQQTPAAASKAAKSTPKPSSVSTKSSTKAPASLKSPVPASQPKSPLSVKQRSPKAESARVIDRKASRSSLTAPTAASVARAASSEKRESLPHKSQEPAKSRPREPTKAAEVSSRLLAPTAASKARHEADSTAKTSAPAPKSLPSRPKPSASSAKPAPRGGLAAPARPESRSSQASSRRPAPPPDGSFLDRMTRPTASSASRVHDKVEVKSPPRKKDAAPARKTSAPPKANGVAKAGSKVIDKVKDTAGKVKEKVTGDEQHSEGLNGHSESHPRDSHATESKVNGTSHEVEGTATPITHSGETSTEAALETTPAFGEQEIR